MVSNHPSQQISVFVAKHTKYLIILKHTQKATIIEKIQINKM